MTKNITLSKNIDTYLENTDNFSDFSKGSLDEWKKLPAFYNQSEKFNPHKFTFLASLGTPFMKFMLYKNCILSLYGEPQTCKTLATGVAMSSYCNPYWGTKILNANKSHTRDLPGYLKKNDGLPFLYMTTELPFDKNLFLRFKKNSRSIVLTTTNKPLFQDTFASGSNPANLNYHIIELYTEKPDFTLTEINEIDHILHNNYGHAAKLVIEEFLKDPQAGYSLLIETYEELCSLGTIKNIELYASVGAVAFVAGTLASGINLLDYDQDAMYKWFIELIKKKEENHDN